MPRYRAKAQYSRTAFGRPASVPVRLRNGSELRFVGRKPLEVGDPVPEEVRKHPYLEPVKEAPEETSEEAPEEAPEKTPEPKAAPKKTARRRTSKKKTSASGGSDA